MRGAGWARLHCQLSRLGAAPIVNPDLSETYRDSGPGAWTPSSVAGRCEDLLSCPPQLCALGHLTAVALRLVMCRDLEGCCSSLWLLDGL